MSISGFEIARQMEARGIVSYGLRQLTLDEMEARRREKRDRKTLRYLRKFYPALRDPRGGFGK